MKGGELGTQGVLYRRADVLTLEPAQPSAEALATAGGRIIAVGSEAVCRAALQTHGAEVEEVDLDGRCLLPGFIDTHLHPIGMLYYDMNADLRGVASIGALQDTLRRAARDDHFCTAEVGAMCLALAGEPHGAEALSAWLDLFTEQYLLGKQNRPTVPDSAAHRRIEALAGPDALPPP